MSPRSPNPGWLLSATLLAALALILVGCGSADVPQGTATSVTTDDAGSPEGPLDYPRGEADLVLRTEQSGGFLPVEAVFTTVPGFSLYGDGRVIYSGPIPEIFPGPALPNLLETRLTEQDVEGLLNEARAAGLDHETADLGQPPVADAGSTIFTLNLNGITHRTEAYALGYEGDSSPAGPGQGQAVFELTPQQREARQRLLDFQNRMMDLWMVPGGEAGPEEPYVYQAIDILSQEVDPGAQDPSGLEPAMQEWPLQDLASLGEPQGQGRRFRVTGADLESLRPQLTGANTLTRWQSGDKTYLLYFRPLLPDEAIEG